MSIQSCRPQDRFRKRPNVNEFRQCFQDSDKDGRERDTVHVGISNMAVLDERLKILHV